MDRIGIKSLLVLALALGGIFEIAKRISWLGTPQVTESDAGELTPRRHYARRALEKTPSHPRSPRERGTMPVATVTKSQRAVYIPPTEGQFDSSVGNKVAEPKQKPQTQDKKTAADKWKAWDKKRRFDPERQCLRKRTAEESQFLELLEAQEPKPKVADAKEPAAETTLDKIGECEDAKEVADQNEKADDPDDHDQQPDSELAVSGPPTISGGILSDRNEGNELDGLEEWKERLLNQPNFKETVRLIEAAQAGRINSALFYKLVELMITDPRPAIQELGVLAAGRTPSHESFHMLIRLVKSETLGSRLRARAEAELKAYEEPRFLPLLERVLKDSTDVFAVVWATKLLGDSASTYLTAKYVKPPTPNGPLAGKNPYVPTFERVVLVLQDLTRAGNHPDESSQARSTLTKIQDLLRALS